MRLVVGCPCSRLLRFWKTYTVFIRTTLCQSGNSAVYAMASCLYVRPSVCRSQVGVLLKRLHGSNIIVLAKRILQFIVQPVTRKSSKLMVFISHRNFVQTLDSLYQFIKRGTVVIQETIGLSLCYQFLTKY